MDPIFSLNQYVLKRKGLGLGGKHELYGVDPKTPLLYIEEKSTLIPLATATHMYRDASKAQEVLTFKDGAADSADTDIFDAASGEKLGTICSAFDTLKEFLSDAWILQDAVGNVIAKFGEKSLGKSLLREFVTHDIAQGIVVMVADTPVAFFNQKNKLIGYELLLDFSMDINHLLDRRLGIAAAVSIANHQARETDL
jgi:hypothetical protein